MLVELEPDAAIGIQPLADFEPTLARHQRIRCVDLETIKMRPGLAADLQQVAKAFCDEQGDGRSLPLNQGVGRNRRAVRQTRHLAHVEVLPAENLFEARRDRLRRIGRSG